MKKNTLVLCLLIMLFCFSCNQVYKEYDKDSFSAFSWNDGQVISFTPTIEDINKNYQLMLGLRYHYEVKLSSFNITMKIISPSGKESKIDHELKIRDAAGHPVGSCAGDLCDLEAMVSEDFKFEEVGEYKVVIAHNEQGIKIPGVMEVGLIIDEK